MVSYPICAQLIVNCWVKICILRPWFHDGVRRVAPQKWKQGSFPILHRPFPASVSLEFLARPKIQDEENKIHTCSILLQRLSQALSGIHLDFCGL